MKKTYNSPFFNLGYKLINENKFIKLNCKNSYSQYGEDSIILTFLNLNQISDVNYMDIGANHPYLLNNTALLYENGFCGVNIEPDPTSFKEIQRNRLKDINLNFGIHEKAGDLIFYQFENSVFNTFSEEEASLLQKKNMKLKAVKKIQVKTYNYVVEKFLDGKPPTILFLDAEGLDETIVDSINFDKYSPMIICVETFAYGIGVKNYNLIKKIQDYGYRVYADTFVNTIFVKNTLVS